MHLIPPTPAFYNGFVIYDFDLLEHDEVLITLKMGIIYYTIIISLDTLVEIQKEEQP